VRERAPALAALPPEERPLFDFAPESIDWWDYWINVHIPALRRWCYPLMDRPPLESREPRALDWSGEAARGAALSKAADADRLFMAIFVNRLDRYLGSYLARDSSPSTATS